MYIYTKSLLVKSNEFNLLKEKKIYVAKKVYKKKNFFMFIINNLIQFYETWKLSLQDLDSQDLKFCKNLYKVNWEDSPKNNSS